MKQNKGISRRAMLARTAAGAGTLLFAPPLLAADALKPAKAKAVIQIWMWGGPAHLDTFDPKPDAGPDYCGPLHHADQHQRQRHPHRAGAAAPGQTGRQIFHHPQHDPRH